MNKKSRSIAFWIAVAALVLAAVQLIRLPLWEYWSLLFLAGGWAAILFYFSLRKKSTALNRKWLFLSSLSGVLLALSFPPFPFTVLIFIGFVPLYFVWRELDKKDPENALKRFWWYAYNAFVVWNIIATFWICNSALLPGIFGIWVNALLMTLPIMLSVWCSQRLNDRLQWGAWVAPWIAFEYGHLNWELSWPWLTLGNAFAEFPMAVQWYSIVGVLGGSMWVLLMNYLITNRIELTENYKLQFSSFRFPLLTLLLPIIVGVVMYFNTTDSGDKLHFSVIQPNYEPHYEKFEVSDNIQRKEILELMSEAVTDSTDYVLLPETVFDNIELTDFNNNSSVILLRDWIEKHPEITIIMGASTYEVLSAEEKDAYTRSLIRRNDTMYYQMQNSALAFDESQREVYFKSKFVPGAEIFPYKNVLFFLKPLVNMLGGSTAGYEPQEERNVFRLGGTAIAPLICYESIYPEYVSEFIIRGAEVIAIMTNDGWWGNTLGYRQHQTYARILAIEMGRGIVRSANTGISSFINRRGDVLKTTDYNERTFINGTIETQTDKTFYVRWGNVIGRFAAFVSLMLLIQCVVSYYKKTD